MVAEVYGPTQEGQLRLAGEIRDLFHNTNGMVDVDWYVEDDQPKYRLLPDNQKAALNGISQDDIVRTIQVASAGGSAGLLHAAAEKEDVPITVRLDRATRSDPERIKTLRVPGRSGGAVALGELVRAEKTVAEKSIYHKNLMPVTYVIGDVAGAMESP